jgi:hypothetical protein
VIAIGTTDPDGGDKLSGRQRPEEVLMIVNWYVIAEIARQRTAERIAAANETRSARPRPNKPRPEASSPR